MPIIGGRKGRSNGSPSAQPVGRKSEKTKLPRHRTARARVEADQLIRVSNGFDAFLLPKWAPKSLVEIFVDPSRIASVGISSSDLIKMRIRPPVTPTPKGRAREIKIFLRLATDKTMKKVWADLERISPAKLNLPLQIAYRCVDWYRRRQSDIKLSPAKLAGRASKNSKSAFLLAAFVAEHVVSLREEPVSDLGDCSLVERLAAAIEATAGVQLSNDQLQEIVELAYPSVLEVLVSASVELGVFAQAHHSAARARRAKQNVAELSGVIGALLRTETGKPRWNLAATIASAAMATHVSPDAARMAATNTHLKRKAKKNAARLGQISS